VFRLTHWLLSASLVVLILTGLSLHAGSRPDWSLLGGKVPGWFWTGRVHYWHAWASLVFAPCILVAGIAYLCRRVRVRVTHVILLVGGVLMLLSGFFLANPPGSAGLYSTSLWVHAIVGLVVIPIWFLWHAITGFTRYLKALVPAFHLWADPRPLPVYGLLALAVLSTCVLLNGWPFSVPWRNLSAARIEQAEVSDPAALPWDEAQSLEIQLANGNAMVAGRTRVDLRAFHNGDELFVKAEWGDDDEDYNYWPWKKTGDGWEYMQTSAEDECRYYEDKFSMVFPIQQDGDFERFGCAASCHLDQDFGWGYKGTTRWLDVWHWKAARTSSVGQADDKYWAQVDFDNEDIGRHGDPKQGGGYAKNRSDDQDHPQFLPESLDDVVKGSIPRDKAVEYTPEKGNAYPTDTIIPGLVTEAFLGDRGQVSCLTQYKQGHWILYLRRRLRTDSAYDVQFDPGEQYAFSCAAFDHAGKRHAYALPTFHLALAP
jgi:hypothetical protein